MKKNILLITGGTGGHVIPAQNLANFLLDKNKNCRIIVDRRGYKFINDFNGKVHLVSSSNLNGNLIFKILGLISLFIGCIQSLFIIIFYKPNIVISFGSYASFFPVLNSIILKPFYKIELFIHEQNSVIGKTNSLFLNFTNKILLNFDIKSKINHKFHNKVYIVGSPEKYNSNYSYVEKKNLNNEFIVSIFGGSQGSEFISKFSSNLIKIIDEEKKIKVKFIFQCPKKIIDKISKDLTKTRSPIFIKDYYSNIDEILSKTSVVISRAGAGAINDFINYKIPSILIPLPTAKDNHQYYNASILAKRDLAIIIKQNTNEIIQAKNFIYKIYNDRKTFKLLNREFDKIKVKNSNSLIYKLINNE